MSKKGMITAREFADAVQTPYPTVMRWLKKGLVPGAVFDESSPRGGVWWVPRSAIKTVSHPKIGRPKKPGPQGAD